MSWMKWTVVLVVFATSLACAPGPVEATAAVVNAAPVWPIPADALAGPPPFAALPAAGETAPPADQIADPVTPGASCGSWNQQSNYGDRWPAGSSWWEYRCTFESYSSYDPCSGGGGACNASCDYCYFETERRTDYFYWNGSDAVFYGEDYYYYLYYWGNLFGEGGSEVSAWWDAPTAKWYDLGPVSLTVSKAGTGSGAVDSSPAGISCGYSCQVSFNPGTVVTLTATPDASSTFTGWSGDCSGSGACEVTMDRARAVTATFSRKTVDLTVSKAGTGSGSVTSSPAALSCSNSCQASFEPGTLVTLTATPNAGSLFTGWSGDCSGTGTCQVTMNQSRSVTASFALKPPPHASFTVTCTGLTCTFDGSGSADPDGSISSYAWAFGDGATGTGVTVSHTFAHSGTYSVSLTVTTDRGASATATNAITVANLAPTAAFTVTCSGVGCTVDASGSADRDGTIASYSWSFGDGSTGSGKTTSHDYPKAGSYTLTLTVTDNDGGNAASSRRINPISLSARGFKQNGRQKVDLSWNGVAGTSFSVYRDGGKIAAVQATAYTDVVPTVPGSHTYRVCASGDPTCSNDATVTF